MKLIIDIPDKDYNDIMRRNPIGSERIISQGTPLGSLVYDIKKDIDQLPKLRYSSGERVYLDEVLEIIDKYLEG